ncbi:MAG: NAD-dependent epimerase/dehydratase family protein [Verrucomicrobiota bacterium]
MIVVAGAGGFIGGHLISHLLQKGELPVRAIDSKPVNDWFQLHTKSENIVSDLSDPGNCMELLAGADEVYNLASDMGGMGFIEANKALCMLSVLINTHMLLAARAAGVRRYFYSSSACVYAAGKQSSTSNVSLKESDAYPAMPEDGYGWEKLFSERMCRHFMQDFGIQTRVARYHNVYGPHGSYQGGREKAPAAICRKIINAKLSGKHEIEIWGDGQQTRSFQYISDCIKGTCLLMDSDFVEPLNIGSSELVTVNQLVDIVEEIAGIQVQRKYNLNAPKGVRGRNSDNSLIRAIFDWEPDTKLRDGMEKTYRWIYDQIAR